MPVRVRASKCCPMCGPKCSIFLMCVSVMGVLFLSLLGLAFFARSNQLIHEVGHYHFEHEHIDFDEMITVVNARYLSSAYNCWIAAALYVVTFVLTFWQHQYNKPICV